MFTITGPPTRKRKGKYYPCSDGVERTTADLGKTIGLSQPAMTYRIKKYGIYSPRLFDPPDSNNNGWIRSKKSKLRAMSGKPRDKNLEKLTVGSWEVNNL